MVQPFLKEGERLDDLQLNGLKIIQKPDCFCFGIDAVLLSDYVRVEKNSRIIDLGTGTGILPLLLSVKTKAAHITGVEIQPDIADMAKRSVEYNKLSERIQIVESDFHNAADWFGTKSFDAVVTNPPYRKVGTGLINPSDNKAISRHEIHCSLESLISVSSQVLKDFGRFFMIHIPERLVDIFYCMRKYRIEPKSMRLVHPKPGKPANLVLVYGLKSGNPQLTVEEPLYTIDYKPGRTGDSYDL
ncbi:MAG: tRNA1(Val) (adenine(37)-N6)-methyltransferase [Clostridiaceae bacterium]|jgi:tRNA1(Val) A37 N6-methylase TrmN6|nr:tRNA1(Val) (adenine(37)-N6)-methyltransferase [Clostridiaceae bacterium]